MSPQEVVDKPHLEGIPLFRQLISHQTYYAFDPNVRTGVDPLMNGYYWMAFAFLLAALASLLRFTMARLPGGEEPPRA